MSIQNNFPALKPTLLLDFANTKELDPRITFTRASTATYYGTQSAKAEENLLIRSQEFDAANWVNSNTTETANTAVAPDGTTTADTLTNTTATGGHTIDQASTAAGFSIVSGQAYTISVFAKKNTNDFFQITTFNASNTLGTGRANFDLQNGTAGTVDGGTSTITSVGNGWYRCTYTVTASASGAVNIYFGIITTSTAARFESYTGLGTESIYLWGAQVEQRSAATAYTATTTQPITNYIPVLETAASGVARFDHNPTTFESLGLLIEEGRTNLLTYSEQFDNAAWTKDSCTITANSVVAPNGTLTADLAIANTSSAIHAVRATYTGTTTTTYSYSVYAKQASGSYEFVISFGASSGTPVWNSGNRASARFNLLTGAVVSTATAGNSTATSSSIVPVGNGWYRCTFVFVPDTTGASTSFSIGQIAAPVSQSVAVPWSGDGLSGAYIWGAQLEAGSFATSYIPTVASQVTRAADVASMTGTNFSSWFNQAEGTIYAEGFLNNPAVTGAQTRRLADISDGSINNRISFGHSASSAMLRTQYVVSGVFLNSTNGQTVSSVFPSAKVAVAYEAANYAFSPNGATPTTSTAASVPVVNRLSIGNDFDGSATAAANGTIKRIAFYPLRLSNTQLQGLTS